MPPIMVGTKARQQGEATTTPIRRGSAFARHVPNTVGIIASRKARV